VLFLTLRDNSPQQLQYAKINQERSPVAQQDPLKSESFFTSYETDRECSCWKIECMAMTATIHQPNFEAWLAAHQPVIIRFFGTSSAERRRHVVAQKLGDLSHDIRQRAFRRTPATVILKHRLTGPVSIPFGAWPSRMCAAHAAAYVGEVSVEAFMRRVGSDYPLPRVKDGRRQLWLRDDLDRALLPNELASAADIAGDL
jgi:hypothetical protein